MSKFAIVCAFCLWTAATAPAQTLAVRGDVSAPLNLTAADLSTMPRTTVTLPNPDGTKLVYDGVPLREVLKRAGAPVGILRGKAMSTYVLVKGRDGYAVAFSLGELDPEFGDASILVADQRDGKPLPADQAPFRLICPNDKAGARSVRMIESIDVVRLVK